MTKAKHTSTPSMCSVEGNKGGSFVTIEQVSEETVRLEVGHECVMRISGKRFLVTDLASTLAWAYEHGKLPEIR